jgi:hypothetical protein
MVWFLQDTFTWRSLGPRVESFNTPAVSQDPAIVDQGQTIITLNVVKQDVNTS